MDCGWALKEMLDPRFAHMSEKYRALKSDARDFLDLCAKVLSFLFLLNFHGNTSFLVCTSLVGKIK